MSLKDRLDEGDAAGWRPSPDDELIGKVVRVNERSSDKGEDYPVVTIRQEDGEKIAFHAFHKVAKRVIEEEQPIPGDEMAVRYLGEKTGASSTYHNYKIVVEHNQMSTKDAEDVAATQQVKEDEADSIPF